MPLATWIVNLFLSRRLEQIERFRRNGAEVQFEQLNYLLGKGRQTAFGAGHGFENVHSYEQFRKCVPVSDYEHFHSLITRTRDGEDSVLWPSAIKWFAKSSGTTDAQSKFIPVTDECLQASHLQGPRDVIAFYTDMFPESDIFKGKTLTLGGSKQLERENSKVFSGDLSAILLENTPPWANLRRVPSVKTALIPDFEEKVRKICEEAVGQNVTAFAGVPSWNLVMLNKVLEFTGKKNILEVWPDMELFIYGGMSFKPYREEYRRMIPTDGMHYLETYNASEGFFAIADDLSRDDMLLMLDYQTFYEFLPISEIGNPDAAVPLEGVTTGENYAMVITSSNGLWRYMIGDTVEFTSTYPYRIRITGRTKHYINAFGEEVVIGNAESALNEACELTGAVVSEFTVAPIYMEGRSKGAHEWAIEFSTPPRSLELFGEVIDLSLQRLNSDYQAKRSKDTTLQTPVITPLEKGTFLRWMDERGKTGGQNKVPRLYNDRTFIDELIRTNNNMKINRQPERVPQL